MIPPVNDIHALTTLVEIIDGLVLTGGGDINPLYLDEEPVPALQDVDGYRDEYEWILLRLATNRQLPIMGICRGHQVINAAFGGTLYQDIYSQAEGPLIKHSQKLSREIPSHSVLLADHEQSLLKQLYPDTDRLMVNSFHHQAVKEVAPEFIETAVAPDGINEAMQHVEKPIFSVQWHPEAMAAAGDEQMLRLFRHEVHMASVFARAKRFHHHHITLDSHTDTPMIFPGHFDIGKKEGGKVNLPFMQEGLIDATVMAAYIPQKERDEEGSRKATALAFDRIDEIWRQEELHGDIMGIARTADDIMRLKCAGKKSILIGVENGYAIGKDIHNLDRLKEKGVVYITLCHNGDNDICDSARGNGEWGGLSPFGKEVVHRMNRLGIMVDISHTAESTFYDALEESEYPIIASHSSVRSLCDHPRNLTDDQIKAIAAKGGVVQLCLYKGFINKESVKASLSDLVRHLNHIAGLVGTDHIGIGSDFDGDGELIGCRSSNELINITVRLLEEGYTEADLCKIWGGNFLRVMNIVQKAYTK